MPDDLLTRMAKTGYGPLKLAAAGGDDYAAKIGDRDVAVSVEGPALRCFTSVNVPWPEGSGASGVDPIVASLEELAHIHRPDLVVIDGAPGDQLDISMWIPVEDATLERVANAVYSTARIATLALSLVTSHGAMLNLDLEPPHLEEEPEDVDIPPPPPPPE